MSQTIKNSGFELYKRLLSKTHIYKGVFIVAIIGMILHAITDTSFAAIIKPLLDGSFIDKDPQFIQIMPFLIVLIFLFRGIGSFMSSPSTRMVLTDVMVPRPSSPGPPRSNKRRGPTYKA